MPVQSRHYIGLPKELTESIDHRKNMPWPKFLIILQDKDGFYLNRYTLDGKRAGDTWHQVLEDAKYQASQEYGNLVLGWQEFPDMELDPVEYVMSKR